MKKILFILLLFVAFQSQAQNRFPSIDSLQTYILKYFRNSTVETFTNYRGQNIVYGLSEFLDSLAGGSSYTSGVGIKIDGSTIRWADTVTTGHVIDFSNGSQFDIRSGSPTFYNRLRLNSSITQLFSENTVTGRYTELYTSPNIAKFQNYNNAGQTADMGVYGGYGNINSFSSGNNTNLNVYPGYWELKVDDTGFPTTLGLDMKGTKDSVTVKTYAGAGIFSFYPTSMKAFKNVNYNTYDSSGYTSLTHIPKQYLEDRLAGISGGGVSESIQNHTSGTTVTVTNGVNILYVNPASTLATLTITLPATPHAGNYIEIYFGGTMTSGDVVTSITISGNTGQTVLQASTPSIVEAGEHISYRWNSSLSKWYRKN